MLGQRANLRAYREKLTVTRIHPGSRCTPPFRLDLGGDEPATGSAAETVPVTPTPAIP